LLVARYVSFITTWECGKVNGVADLLPFDEHAFSRELIELDSWQRRLDTAGSLVMSWDGRLRRDLEAAAVAASTSMEGVPVTVDEVRRILAGDRPASVSVEDADLVSGYRDAMKYVQRRADDPAFEWSAELIKGIQDKVLAGNFAKGAARYGKGRWVADSITGEPLFAPPAESLVPRLIDQTCRRMNTWSAHPALRSAWIHVAIAAIHPFRDGNGRTARVLSSLAMYRGGFKRPEFCSLEEWWGRHRVAYYDAFSCLGAEFKGTTDVTPFVAAHIAAQVSQVRALDLRLRVDRRIWMALEALCDQRGVPRRAANALWDAFYERDVQPLYYRKLADVGEVTATKDLRGLRAAGLLISTGQTRARRYLGTQALYTAIAEVLALPDGADTRDAVVAELTRNTPVDQMIFSTDSATGSDNATAVPAPGFGFSVSGAGYVTAGKRPN
jgi:Fic family protein